MNDLMLPQDNLLSLPESVKENLVDYEDFVSFYSQINSAHESISWLKADLYQHLSQKLGEDSLDKFSVSIQQPRSTVSNYIRTARAFPAATRTPDVSFSHHMQASFADKFSESEDKFLSDKRFEYLEKASDENLSTRRLQVEIQQDKQKEEQGVEILPCDKCHKSEEETGRLVIYLFGRRNEPARFTMCKTCQNKVVEFAKIIE